jgi:diguanylate cyclase (GGDEF)-like protein
MMDLDGLKSINDNRGHQMGSLCIAEVGKIVGEEISPVGRACRYGGDEFIAYVEVPESGAAEVAERIRTRVESFEFIRDGVRVHSTISIGLAELKGGLASPDHLLQAADEALYRAKRAGRNRGADARRALVLPEAHAGGDSISRAVVAVLPAVLSAAPLARASAALAAPDSPCRPDAPAEARYGAACQQIAPLVLPRDACRRRRAVRRPDALEPMPSPAPAPRRLPTAAASQRPALAMRPAGRSRRPSSCSEPTPLGVVGPRSAGGTPCTLLLRALRSRSPSSCLLARCQTSATKRCARGSPPASVRPSRRPLAAASSSRAASSWSSCSRGVRRRDRDGGARAALARFPRRRCPTRCWLRGATRFVRSTRWTPPTTSSCQAVPFPGSRLRGGVLAGAGAAATNGKRRAQPGGARVPAFDAYWLAQPRSDERRQRALLDEAHGSALALLGRNRTSAGRPRCRDRARDAAAP